MLRHRLLYTVCALGMAPAMGCVFVSDGGGSNGNGNGNGNARGHFDVAWKVDGLSETGDGCLELDGADSVEIVSQPLSGGTAYEDIYDCDDGSGVTATMPLDDYDVWANVRDSDGRLLAQSQIVTASLDYDGHLRVINEELAFLNAQFEASWDLTEEITEDLLACEDVGAGSLSFVSSLAGSGGTSFDDIHDCEDGIDPDRVQTDPMPLGDYTVSVTLLEAETDEILGQADPKDGTLSDHASVEDLGVFEFTFAPETAQFRVFWDPSTDKDDTLGDGCQALEFEPGELLTVEVVFERAGGFRAIEQFDCEDADGLSGDLPLGDYEIWANVADESGRLLASSAPDLILEASLTEAGEEVEVPPDNDEFTFFSGVFEASWDLIEENTEDLLSCDEVGVGGVSFVSSLADAGGTGFDDIFDCEDGIDPDRVETDPLPIGEYTVSVSVLEDGTDEVLGTAEPKENELVDHRDLVDLGVFEFIFPEA